MDDPAFDSLPDDPRLLKQIILQRDSALGLCDLHIEELERRAAERIESLSRELEQTKAQAEQTKAQAEQTKAQAEQTKAELELDKLGLQQAMERAKAEAERIKAELELDKLRLQQQLLVAMKKLYGPRGDRLSGEGDGLPDGR